MDDKKRLQLEAFSKLIGEIEKVVEDENKAEINGRVYQLSKMTHKDRLPFLQYYQDLQPNPLTGASKISMDFGKVEDMLAPFVLFENGTLKNMPNHFDKYAGDYMPYINTMLLVVVYPFLSETLRRLRDM